MIEEAYIVATARDGTKRLFKWSVGGNGPDNTWTILSAIVDRNLASSPPHDPSVGARWEIIRIQAAILEPIDGANGPRR